jgi:hypothetical protein
MLKMHDLIVNKRFHENACTCVQHYVQSCKSDNHSLSVKSDKQNSISNMSCVFKSKKQTFHAYGLWIKMTMQPQMCFFMKAETP